MKIWIVDAFSATPFTGNPAGVCIVEEFPGDEYMQDLAMEINHAETAFVKPLGEADFAIRWFTPREEAPLCAHATLAAAHILWQTGSADRPLISFDSAAGPLSAQRREDGWIRLDYPAKPITPQPMPELLNRALGFFPVEALYGDDMHRIVVLSSTRAVFDLKPTLSKIEQLPFRAVTITALNDGLIDKNIDYVYRYFAPAVGIPEDWVCGSINCRLAPYWGRILQKKEMTAYAASMRGGYVRVETASEDRVCISGQACTVMEANLLSF